MINQELKLPTLPQTDSSLPPYRVSSTGARTMAYSAMLTLALSLPQGLLALPIAVAQVGLARGLPIMLLIGALNSVTAAWTAQFVAVQFMRHGIVPSLATLAHDRLGTWGWRLTLGSGTTLFFWRSWQASWDWRAVWRISPHFPHRSGV